MPVREPLHPLSGVFMRLRETHRPTCTWGPALTPTASRSTSGPCPSRRPWYYWAEARPSSSCSRAGRSCGLEFELSRLEPVAAHRQHRNVTCRIVSVLPRLLPRCTSRHPDHPGRPVAQTPARCPWPNPTRGDGVRENRCRSNCGESGSFRGQHEQAHSNETRQSPWRPSWLPAGARLTNSRLIHGSRPEPVGTNRGRNDRIAKRRQRSAARRAARSRSSTKSSHKSCEAATGITGLLQTSTVSRTFGTQHEGSGEGGYLGADAVTQCRGLNSLDWRNATVFPVPEWFTAWWAA